MSESEEKPATENKKAAEVDSPTEEAKQDDSKNKALEKTKKATGKPPKAATASLKKGVKKENADLKSEENGEGDKKAAENETETRNDKKAAVSNEKKVKKSETEEKEEEPEEASDENEEEEDDGDDVPKKKPLLDMPLEVSGARERKKVERLTVGFNVSREKNIGEGEGEKLSEISNFDANLAKMKPNDLKPLHKLLFNRPGTAVEIKKNIRSFNGFPFKSFSPEYEKKKAMIEKLTIPAMKKMCSLLCLDKSGSTKEEISAKLLDFLMKPETSATSVKTKVSVKKAEKPKPRSGARTSGRKKKNKSYAEVSDSENEEMNEEEEDEKAEPEVTEDPEVGSEESEEKMESEEKDDTDDDWDKGRKKNKTAKKANAKPAPKKEESRKADKEASKEKKAPARSKAKQKKTASSEEEGSSDDDEPLAKKSKKPPTDDELKALIKKILDGANLEEITMKTVCKQVYASFPEFDLSDRKEFIKDTVRSIIS